MKKFNYKVFDKSGKKIKNTTFAQSKIELADNLSSKGYKIIEIDEVINFDFAKLLSADIGGIPLKERLIFLKQFSTMISAGIPIIETMDLLIKNTEKKSFKEKLEKAIQLIQSGNSITESFRKVDGIFSETQLGLLSAGEKSGNLVEILSQISIDMERSKNLRSKVSSALIYPAILFIVMIFVIILLIVFLVPQVKELYSSLGQGELPGTTQFLINFSTFLTNGNNLLFLVFAFITIAVVYRYYDSTTNGSIQLAKFRMRIPVFGEVIKKSEIAEFCRINSMLMNSGISIVEALEISTNATNNKVYKSILSNSFTDIVKGQTLSSAIAKNDNNGYFPTILIKIIAVGEESGKLDKVLDDMSKFYQNEFETLTNNLSKLIEPIIMVVAGVVVGFLALAVYGPTFQIIQNIRV